MFGGGQRLLQPSLLCRSGAAHGGASLVGGGVGQLGGTEVGAGDGVDDLDLVGVVRQIPDPDLDPVVGQALHPVADVVPASPVHAVGGKRAGTAVVLQRERPQLPRLRVLDRRGVLQPGLHRCAAGQGR